MLGDCDWIVEAVLEKLEVKQDVYRKIDGARKAGSVVSSNTSTLPIHELVKGLSPSFAKDFMITHFFNPPRFMRLLEVVKGKDTRADAFETISANLQIMRSAKASWNAKTRRVLLRTASACTG